MRLSSFIFKMPRALTVFLPLILGVAVWGLIAAHKRANVPLWETEIPRYYNVGQGIGALAFSPDSKKLAVADRQGFAHIFNLGQKKSERRFKDNASDVQSLAWPAGTALAFGATHSFRVFSLPSGREILEAPTDWQRKSYQYQKDHYSQTALAARAPTAALGQVHGAVAGFDTVSGKSLYRFKIPLRETCGLALSANGKRLAVGSILIQSAADLKATFYKENVGFEIAIRDGRTGKLQKTLRWDNAGMNRALAMDGNLGEMGLAFSRDGAFLVSTSTSGAALWDLKRGKMLHSLKVSGNVGGKKIVEFSPDGAWVAAVGWFERTHVWSAKTGMLKRVFYGPAHQSQNALSFSPDGKLLAIGGDSGTGTGSVRVWNVKNLR